MAAATKQSQAAQGANDLQAVIAQLLLARNVVDDYVRRYTAANWNSYWNNMPTAPANADGTLGTADNAPNNAHPIDTRVVGTLTVPVAANDLVNAVAALQALQNYFTGGAVAQANRDAVFGLFRLG